jgi:hypothetical protein
LKSLWAASGILRREGLRSTSGDFTMNTQVAVEPQSDEARMGTVDTLLGLIAAVACAEPGRLIPVGDFYNILHKLKGDSRFSSELRYLDFEAVGDSFYSQALDRFLFQAGTWGLHQVPNPAVSSISLDRDRAENRLQQFEREYGPERVRWLREKFAPVFIQEMKQSR